MSGNEEERITEVLSQWPTLKECFACVDCDHLFRTALATKTCPRCGSSSVFNVAALLHAADGALSVDISDFDGKRGGDHEDLDDIENESV
jgi:hypothetical protein